MNLPQFPVQPQLMELQIQLKCATFRFNGFIWIPQYYEGPVLVIEILGKTWILFIKTAKNKKWLRRIPCPEDWVITFADSSVFECSPMARYSGSCHQPQRFKHGEDRITKTTFMINCNTVWPCLNCNRDYGNI